VRLCEEESCTAMLKLVQVVSVASIGCDALRVNTAQSELPTGQESSCVVATYYENIGVNAPSMLHLWNESWTNAGFKTLVLGREDAQKYPRYEMLLENIQSLPAPYSTSEHISTYDVACFLRWAAMSALPHPVFMADMDVMNLDFKASEWCANSQLPKQTDEMLLFDRHVPSLVYGASKAYERITKLFENTTHQMVETMKKEDKQWPISDMGALGFIMEHQMAPYSSPREKIVFPGIRCNEDGNPVCQEDIGALHFSHSSFDRYWPKIARNAEDIRKIMSWYVQHCHKDRSKYPRADPFLIPLHDDSAKLIASDDILAGQNLDTYRINEDSRVQGTFLTVENTCEVIYPTTIVQGF